MKPGPKPKPTQMKKLAGNPGRRPLNRNEPQFEVPSRMLNTPDFLDETAGEVWRDLGRQLLDAGLFTTVDKYALAMFCVAASRWIEAERQLQGEELVLVSEETGNPYQNPRLHVANKAWEQMRQLFNEFGLTPAERARLSVGGGEREPSLAELLNDMVRQQVERAGD